LWVSGNKYRLFPFSSLMPLQHPDRLWSSQNLLSGGYWVSFLRVKSARGMKSIIYFHLLPRLRIVRLCLHSRYTSTFMLWRLLKWTDGKLYF
jgi:hypothetical protein